MNECGGQSHLTSYDIGFKHSVKKAKSRIFTFVCINGRLSAWCGKNIIAVMLSVQYCTVRPSVSGTNQLETQSIFIDLIALRNFKTRRS